MKNPPQMFRFEISPRVCGLAVLLVAVAACGHDHHGTNPAVDEYFYDCEDPKRPAGLMVYATDESLVEMLNKEAAGVKDKPEEAASLVMPAAQSTLSATTAPTFVLMPPVTGAELGSPPRFTPPARPRRSLFDRALAWLQPIGTAYAHCKPVTGDNFLFRLTKDGEDKAAYATIASVTSFTPTAETWKKAMTGRVGQTLKLTLLRAHYSGGTITDGPFVGSANVTFSVGP